MSDWRLIVFFCVSSKCLRLRADWLLVDQTGSLHPAVKQLRVEMKAEEKERENTIKPK